MDPLLTKREHAKQILTALMAGRDRITIADAVEAGAVNGISAKTMKRAKTDLGLVMVPNGPHGAFWERP